MELREAQLQMLTEALTADSQKKKKHTYELNGVIDAGKAHITDHIRKNAGRDTFALFIAENEKKATELAAEYAYFCEDTYYFPAKDLLFYQSDIS